MNSHCAPLAHRNSREGGFSLIEVLLALGLVSFVIVPIIGLLGMGFTNYRSASELSAKAAIIQSLRSQSAGLTNSGQYLGDTFFAIDGTETSATDSAATYKSVSKMVTLAKISGADSATLINNFSIIRIASQQVIMEGVIHITPR